MREQLDLPIIDAKAAGNIERIVDLMLQVNGTIETAIHLCKQAQRLAPHGIPALQHLAGYLSRTEVELGRAWADMHPIFAALGMRYTITPDLKRDFLSTRRDLGEGGSDEELT